MSSVLRAESASAVPPRSRVVALVNGPTRRIRPSNHFTDVPNLAPSQIGNGRRKRLPGQPSSLPDVQGVRLDTEDPTDLLGSGQVLGLFHSPTVGVLLFPGSAARRPAPTDGELLQWTIVPGRGKDVGDE